MSSMIIQKLQEHLTYSESPLPPMWLTLEVTKEHLKWMACSAQVIEKKIPIEGKEEIGN